MADLSITATSVIHGDGKIEHGILGAVVTAGQVVYEDDATDTIKLADSNGAVALRAAKGIALNGGAVGQPVAYQKSGPITIGATLTAGADYLLSDTPGGICPDADVGAGEEVVRIGYAQSTTVLVIDIQNTGVTR